MSTKKKTLGRDVIGLLLDEVLIEGDGSTTKILKGHLFAKKEIAKENSIFGEGTIYENVMLGRPTMAATDLTLATGDKAVDLGDPFEKTPTGEWKYLIGYGRSKSINFSKNTVDMTVDEDEYADQQSDGLVAISGDLNGYKLNVNPADSATFKIENMFIDVVVQDETTGETHEKSTPTVIVGILYQKTAESGDKVEMDIVPCQFTSMGDSADYGSATSRNLSWTGVSRSDKGIIPTKVQVKIPAEN